MRLKVSVPEEFASLPSPSNNPQPNFTSLLSIPLPFLLLLSLLCFCFYDNVWVFFFRFVVIPLTPELVACRNSLLVCARFFKNCSFRPLIFSLPIICKKYCLYQCYLSPEKSFIFFFICPHDNCSSPQEKTRFAYRKKKKRRNKSDKLQLKNHEGKIDIGLCCATQSKATSRSIAANEFIGFSSLNEICIGPLPPAPPPQPPKRPLETKVWEICPSSARHKGLHCHPCDIKIPLLSPCTYTHSNSPNSAVSQSVSDHAFVSTSKTC